MSIFDISLFLIKPPFFELLFSYSINPVATELTGIIVTFLLTVLLAYPLGKYIAKVRSVTDDCKITVSVEGKVAGVSQFRVRTIPTPVATVGGVASNENMTAGQFRAQTGVGAYIKDFPLNLKYSVTSFTLAADNVEGDIEEAACTGYQWSPKALNMIKNLQPGRTVSIENIRATGPDGRNQKLPGLTYYIK